LICSPVHSDILITEIGIGPRLSQCEFAQKEISDVLKENIFHSFRVNLPIGVYICEMGRDFIFATSVVPAPGTQKKDRSAIPLIVLEPANFYIMGQSLFEFFEPLSGISSIYI
jgi:hypothetical protein